MDQELRRLRQFFRYNIPLNYVIAAVMFALWLVFAFWALLGIALSVAANIALLHWAQAQLRRQRIERAAIAIAAGVLLTVFAGACLSGGMVLPIMAVLPMWPVLIALPYLGKSWLLRIMLASTGCALFVSAVSLAGDMTGLSGVVPRWIPEVVTAVCLPIFTGFMCLFVWHYSRNLSEALSRSRAAERELELKVAERTQELASKNQELLALDEMKTRFVSNASHELRSPLTSIRAFSELLANDDSLTESQAEFARIINAECERLTRLANDLLDLGRMEAGYVEWHPRPLDLRTELRLVLETQLPLAQRKGLTLEMRLPPKLPDVRADPDGLRRVLLNLVDNAVKFTDRGQVLLSAEPAGRRVRVEVADTGPGISAEDQAHVFERFYQAGNMLTEKPAGAGLGLAICREILSQHRTELRLDSQLGRGSRFSFELPVG
jgi:signal transduction histidine kinase